MKKTYLRLMLRSIKRSLTRYLSILTIVMVGAGFFAGLIATSPDMEYTVDKYYNESNTADYILKSNYGFTNQDIKELDRLPYIKKSMPVYCFDVSVLNNEGESFVARVFGTDFSKYDSADYINKFIIKDGTMPVDAGHCVIVSPNDKYQSSHKIGDIYTIDPNSKNYSDIREIIIPASFEVSAFADSPFYSSIESEPSSAGSGAVSFVIYIDIGNFDLDYYTDILLVLEKEGLNRFSAGYTERIKEIQNELEAFAEDRQEIRFNEIYNDANSEYIKNTKLLAKEKDDVYSLLDEYKTQLEETDKELSDYREQLKTKKQEYNTALEKIIQAEEASGATLEEERKKLMLAKLEIDSFEQRLSESCNEYNRAVNEYEENRREADEKFSEADTELAEAKEKIDSIEKCTWYHFTLENNVSYKSIGSNIDKVAAIARVFPGFLFLVAALVALTTMTRMVEEERTQIGTLKALGYSGGSISAYYIGYSFTASLLGCIIGSILGFNILPKVIYGAYSMLYTLPVLVTRFYPGQFILVTVVSVGLTTLSTLAVCRSELIEKPSVLILPRAPKAGRKIFLEHIGFIWKRLKFTVKVTIRNLVRYKKRFFMTVIGIAGCMALLVTGFGLKESINAIVDIQFNEIYNYNLTVTLKSGITPDDDPELKDTLDNKDFIKNYSLFRNETVHVGSGDELISSNLVVPLDTAGLENYFTLREYETQKAIPFGENSVVISKKMSEELGLKTGDSFKVQNINGAVSELILTGITENYVMNNLYISKNIYIKMFDKEPEYNTVYANSIYTGEKERDEYASLLLGSDNVLYAGFSDTIKESFSDSVKSIDSIVIVLIAAAAVLAVIVLYNLTNINISERIKELATIKVLGFYDGEVAAYIYRETTVLCIIGILAGCIFGKLLHLFVIRTAEVDGVMFGRYLNIGSYLVSALITLVFTLIVDLIMYKKLKSIDMVESMKAND